MKEKICHYAINLGYKCKEIECSLWDHGQKQCSDLTKNLAMYAIQKVLSSLKAIGKI